MKKILLFAAAALMMTVGCSKIQALINPDKGQEPVDDTTPVEIKFTTNVANVETKGVGALTGLTNSNTLYIYGLNKSTGKEQIINKEATADAVATPDADGVYPDATGVLTFKNNATFFYNGTKDRYEFYGYYVDDAAGDAPAPDATDYTLSVNVTGTQDILLAKATPANDVPEEGSYASEYTEESMNWVYSAWSARRGTTPNLVFEHALTQYTFEIQNKGTADLVLNSIEVTAKTAGILTVAGASQGLALDPDNTAESNLTLDSETLKNEVVIGQNADSEDIKVTGAEIKTGAEATSLDGEIMTFAGQNNKVILTLSQKGLKEGQVRRITMPITLDTTEGSGVVHDNGKTKAGYRYDVAITIYSLEEVKLNVTLKQWQKGGSISLDPDKMDPEDVTDVLDPENE